MTSKLFECPIAGKSIQMEIIVKSTRYSYQKLCIGESSYICKMRPGYKFNKQITIFDIKNNREKYLLKKN